VTILEHATKAGQDAEGPQTKIDNRYPPLGHLTTRVKSSFSLSIITRPPRVYNGRQTKIDNRYPPLGHLTTRVKSSFSLSIITRPPRVYNGRRAFTLERGLLGEDFGYHESSHSHIQAYECLRCKSSEHLNQGTRTPTPLRPDVGLRPEPV
jgi:hypothetical protein